MKKLFLTASAFTVLAITGCHHTHKTTEHKEFQTISKFADLEGKAGNTIYFAFDSSELSSQAKNVLDSQVKYMNKHPNQSFVIEGHTDKRGTKEYNLALGERRANSAKAYLVSAGIADSKLTVVSYGKEKPASVGDSEEVWSLNRRAVTIVKN